jgi:hypothetical protein
VTMLFSLRLYALILFGLVGFLVMNFSMSWSRGQGHSTVCATASMASLATSAFSWIIWKAEGRWQV